jgi:hypothetical protein
MKLMKGCNYAALGKKYFTVIDISINHEGKVIKLMILQNRQVSSKF